MRKMIKSLFSAIAFSLCAVQTVALAGPVIMPRVYIPPVRIAPVTPTVKVTPPPARVQAPKTSQPDTTAASLIPIMTGIAVMNATSSANAANAANAEQEQNERSEESSEDLNSVKE